MPGGSMQAANKVKKSSKKSVDKANVGPESQPNSCCAFSVCTCVLFIGLWPLTIMALYFSNKSRNALAAGNIDEAKRYGALARNVNIGACVAVIALVGTAVALILTNYGIFQDTANDVINKVSDATNISIPTVGPINFGGTEGNETDSL